MEYKIMGIYQGRSAEVVDTAETEEEAAFLLKEYKLAFGQEWTLYIRQQTETATNNVDFE